MLGNCVTELYERSSQNCLKIDSLRKEIFPFQASSKVLSRSRGWLLLGTVGNRLTVEDSKKLATAYFNTCWRTYYFHGSLAKFDTTAVFENEKFILKNLYVALVNSLHISLSLLFPGPFVVGALALNLIYFLMSINP